MKIYHAYWKYISWLVRLWQKIEFEDGVMAAPGLKIATINHDMYDRHLTYTYGKVLIKKNAWLGLGATICPGVTIGKYAVVAAGAVVTKTCPIMLWWVAYRPKLLKC